MAFKLKATLGVALAAFFLAAAYSGPAGASADESAQHKIPYIIQERIEALRAGADPGLEAGAVTEVEPLAGQEAPPLPDFPRINQAGAVYVEIHGREALRPEHLEAIEALGGMITSSTADIAWPNGIPMPAGLAIIVAWVPFDQLEAVAEFDWVAVIRPVEETPPDQGDFLSEGVRLHRADDAQDYGIDGAGVTVGAISDGIDSLAAAQASGDLPATVTVPAGCPAGAGSGDEGTAMLEIVHDMAPGAALLYCGTGGGVANHVAAQAALVNAGADVITEDIPFDAEPAFQRGLAATTGDAIAALGVGMHSSAGNQAARHAARVQAIGTGGGPDGQAGPFAGCPVGFSPGNVVAIAPGGDTTFDIQIQPDNNGNRSLGVTLQWSEPRAIFPTAGAGGFTDLNLYVMDAALTQCLGASVGVQGNGAGDTIEQVSLNFGAGGNINAKLVVDVQNAPAGVTAPTIDLRWRGAVAVDTPTRAGSLNPDSNYSGLATSAAAANAGASTNPVTVGLEGFSSGGPVQLLLTTVCPGGVYPCPGNAVAGPAGQTFGAPDWTAADGVRVSGAGGFGAGTCPAVNPGDVCRFFGTSAAAPHAAACEALVRSNVPGITVAEINNRLAAAAVDRGDPGFDNAWGWGVLDCLAAAIQADLEVEKTGPAGPVAAGTEITYTVTVRNHGPDTSPEFTVRDVLPTGLSFVSASPGCAPAGAGVVECVGTNLASGGATAFQVTALIAANLVYNNGGPLSVTNIAMLFDSVGLDPNPANDSDDVSTLVVAVADLEVVEMGADDPPTEVLIGEPVQIDVFAVINNKGPSAPMDVILKRSAQAPAGSTVSPTPTSDPEDALGLDENRKVTRGYTITCGMPGLNSFSFHAEIEPASDDDTDPNPANNKKSTTVQLDCVVPVAINIKPKSFPNSINPDDRGLTPVAVLTTEAGEYGLPFAFDAATIDAATVRFGPYDDVWSGTGGAFDSDGRGALERSYELDEKTRDRDLDMVLHFRTLETGIQHGDTEACVKGQAVVMGIPAQFFGCDSVRTVAP